MHRGLLRTAVLTLLCAALGLAGSIVALRAAAPESRAVTLGAVDVHVGWAADEVTKPEPATLGCRRQRRRVHDGLYAVEGTLNTFAGGQVATYPIDTRIATGRAGKDPHLMLLSFQKTHDITAKVARAAGDEYEIHGPNSAQVNRYWDSGSGRRRQWPARTDIGVTRQVGRAQCQRCLVALAWHADDVRPAQPSHRPFLTSCR